MKVRDIKLNFEVDIVEFKQRLKLIEQCLNNEIDLETAKKQIKKIDDNICKILSSIREIDK